MAIVDGVFANQRRLRTSEDAFNFLFRSLARKLNISVNDFKKSGLGVFGQPTRISLRIRPVQGADINIFALAKGFRELHKVLTNDRILGRLIREAYKSTIIPAILSQYPPSIAKTKGGGKSLFNKVLSSIRSDLDNRRIVVKNGAVSLGTFDSWVKSRKFQDRTTKSAFNNIFLILELGSGPQAFFVRPFQSTTVTPWKIPESIAGESGLWVSDIDIRTKLHARIEGEKKVARRNITDPAKQKKLVKYAGTPFGELAASRGFEPIGALITPGGRIREYKTAKKRFGRELARLIDARVKSVVKSWPNLVSSSLSASLKTPIANIATTIIG